MNKARGFTLLEVLVALGIFAIIAASVLISASDSLRTAAHLEDKTLAAWVADNRMTELQLQRPAAEPGQLQLNVQFANRQWSLRQVIHNTESPYLRRVSLQVEAPTQGSQVAQSAIFELSGFLKVQP